jgi:hypothetical protein
MSHLHQSTTRNCCTDNKHMPYLPAAAHCFASVALETLQTENLLRHQQITPELACLWCDATTP